MRWVAIASLMLLAGCQKSFDDRYADAEKKIREQADSIDKDLSDKASEAALGDEATAPVTMPSGAQAASPPPS
jgi:hypothetical protein